MDGCVEIVLGFVTKDGLVVVGARTRACCQADEERMKRLGAD